MKNLEGNLNNGNIDLLIKRYENICENVNSGNIESFIDAVQKVKTALEDLRNFLSSPLVKDKLAKFKQATSEDIDTHSTALLFEKLNAELLSGVGLIQEGMNQIAPVLPILRKAPNDPLAKEFQTQFNKNILPSLKNINPTLRLIKKLINQ